MGAGLMTEEDDEDEDGTIELLFLFEQLET
jgi:hypothetical protein